MPETDLQPAHEPGLKSAVLKRLQTCTTLPSPPGVALQLLNLIGEPSVGVAELATVIRQDPALSAKVLKIVNSPLYTLRRNVSTLSHAISLLGFHAVETIALSFSLASTFQTGGSHGFDRSRFWKRSVISAVTAQKLGSLMEVPSQETLFVGALLQDLGMLALSEIFRDGYTRLAEMAENKHSELIHLERQAFGDDHAAVGGWLLKKWHFPEVLTEIVRASHGQLREDLPVSLRPTVGSVALSGEIADIWVNPEEEEQAGRVAQLAKALLRLEPEELAPVLEETPELLKEVSEVFDMDIQSPAELEQILAQAREALFMASLSSAALIHKTRVKVDSLEVEVDRLRERAKIDPLTKLLNRGSFERIFAKEFSVAQTSGVPLTLVVCDIDHFKTFNDSYGHTVGDKVLEEVARVLQSKLRSRDIATRYGGEEFTLILPNTGEKEAGIVCERIREEIAKSKVMLDCGDEVGVTISLGYASTGRENTFQSPSQLFKAADRAMYAAKKAGRNEVARSGQQGGTVAAVN